MLIDQLLNELDLTVLEDGVEDMNALAAEVPKARVTETAAIVVMAMRQMGVVGLPRNYEVFYEALAGSIPELTQEFAALGKRPTQEDIDRLGQKYFTANHGQGLIESTREQMSRELEEVMLLLIKERNSLEKYGRILDQTAEGLNKRQLITKDILQKIASVMATATDTTIDHGKQIVQTMGDKSAELEKVKSKLEEYKRLADTDPLTKIYNRRAFDRAIARIYDSRRSVAFNTLILADIDRFKDINDRFGHPVGDKIIQIVAGIFKAKGRETTFVARTGGEEFAMILEGMSEDASRAAADAIRAAIEQTPFVNKKTGQQYGPVTISIGVCMATQADSPDDLYAKADRALYKSKMNGRNQVTLYSPQDDARNGKNWQLYKRD